KRLHLEKDDADSLYHCPIHLCEHEGFQSQRGCRKHVNNKHSWFFYFDEKPRVDLKIAANSSKVPTKSCASSTVVDDVSSGTRSKPSARSIPSFSTSGQIGEQFATWLSGSGGGYKKERTAQQIVNRCLKFLKFCCEEEEELNFEVMDFSLCSPSLLFKFIDYLQEECKLGHGGRLGYIDAISELIDFRKVNDASDGVLRKLSATELYIKRARKTVAKMMRLQWTQDLDVESLEARGHWATMEELLEVVSFHLPRYEQTVKTCQYDPGQVNPSDLTFATKFLATYLFIKVKGSRPMTYQYLTVEMVKAAKANGGFIDQKTFKTAGKYGFDSVILTDTSMQILDGYINLVRPLLKPQGDFVLVTKNGSQHSKLGNEMSKLVFDAIGKYIHPTRYRQIVETQSLDALDDKEHQVLSEDQKHSSIVAKVHYQKRRSREVAVKAHECLQKLQGTKGSEVDMEVNTRFGSSSSTVTFEPTFECARSENARHKIDTPPHSNRLLSQGHQRRPLRFTTDEDEFLKRGIDKHGFGQWTAILRDPDFHFQKGRLANSLKKRAELKFFVSNQSP
ncbi:uncharacterized protein, partial [Montipora capricornis]|uniref:uncharacterized protein n=1 Tax=Montipora capricornis TaxID=246305 RepID=UPI0035F11F8A